MHGQAVLQEECIERHHAEQEQRIADQPIACPANSAHVLIFADRQDRHVSDAPMVQISGRGVVERVRLAPDIVGSQSENADHPPDPVAEAPAAEQRPVAAIMLEHEQTDEKGRIR